MFLLGFYSVFMVVGLSCIHVCFSHCLCFYKYKCLCSLFMLICPVYMFVFACSVFVFMVVVNLSCIHVCFSLCSC